MSLRRTTKCSAFLALALAGWGCAPAVVSLREGPRIYTSENYRAVLGRWTRSGNAYSLQDLDDHLAVTATYESWDFRWAYVVRYAADFRLPTTERTRLLEASLATGRREHEFYVALASDNVRWGQLTHPTSAWRVLMVNDRRVETAPTAIDPVDRPGALERTYFPYTNVWRQAFRVRFPRTVHTADRGEVELLGPGTKYFILRFTGPQGSVDLTWHVEG